MSINTDKLTFLPRTKILRERKVMLILDNPLAIEITAKVGFSSPSAKNVIVGLAKAGIPRAEIHTTYLFQFRPEKGDLSAVFLSANMPLSEYRSWEQDKKVSLLSFAYKELETLKEEIKQVNPDLIVCAGRWAFYFLSGLVTTKETEKSQFGTLLKWRGSHLELGNFWEYEKPHILLPILPPTALWQLPAEGKIIQQDYFRCGLVGKAAIKGDIEKYIPDKNPKFIIAPTFQQIKDFFFEELARLEGSETLIPYAVDVETKLGFQDCIGIAKSSTEAICIPFTTKDNPHYWTELQELEILNWLSLFLGHRNAGYGKYPGFFGQNFWYDMQYIWRDLFIKVLPSHDSMILNHTMFAGLPKNLAFLASLYAKKYKYWKDDGKLALGKTDKEHWIYNCRDCCFTFEIVITQLEILSAQPDNIKRAYERQIRQTLPAAISMMDTGLREDSKTKDILRNQFRKLIAEKREDLDYIVGEPFNIGSPQQKIQLLYNICKLPVQYDAKTKRPTTGKEVLETLKEIEPLISPIVDRIAELGQFNTLTSTFLESKPDIDGRMRCNYNICGTDTFRFSSSENAFGSGGNFQNIPKEHKTVTGVTLPSIRNLFIPDPGMCIWDVDLDSADLRIVTAESGAKGLQQMFKEGKKPYIEMMKEFYHDPGKNKNSPEYGIFKAVCHGTNYIGSAAGLAGRVGLIVHEVDRLQKWYFGANPEIKQWHEELKKQVYKRGYIENIFGYRKYFWDKSIPTLMQIAAAWKPQSSVGLLINEGMWRIYSQEPEIQLLLQVHDSLVGQSPIDKPDLLKRVVELCEIELPYENPITIPVGIKSSTISWGGCE